MVLFRCLILLKTRSILMKADEGELETFAAFDRIRDGWSSHYEAMIFHTGQGFKSLEIRYEFLLVLFAHFRPKLEQYCLV